MLTVVMICCAWFRSLSAIVALAGARSTAQQQWVGPRKLTRPQQSPCDCILAAHDITRAEHGATPLRTSTAESSKAVSGRVIVATCNPASASRQRKVQAGTPLCPKPSPGRIAMRPYNTLHGCMS